MITQTYTISTIKQSTPPIVKMSQYDHGSRTITFSVVDGSGQAVVLTGKTVRVEGTRLDGHAFAEDCTVSGSTASFTDTSDMTNAPGAHPAELVIESDGDRLGTMNFVIAVETAAMDENADITEEDVSLFEQLLGSIEDATGAVEAEKTAALSAIDDDKDAALLAIAHGLASGSPLVVDAVADMTDQTAVYLYSGSESGYTAGNFYFWNGSAWVSGGTYGNPTVDAAFSDSSVNPVQNKVVSAAVSSLKSELRDGFDYDYQLIETTEENGIYSKRFVLDTSNAAYKHIDIPVIQGEKFKVSGFKYGADYPSTFYLMNGSVVSYDNALPSGTYNNDEITIPSGVDEIVINYRSSNGLVVLKNLPLKSVTEIEALNYNAYVFDEISVTKESGIYDTAGALTQTGQHATIDVLPGEKYKIIAYSWSSTSYPFYIFKVGNRITGYQNVSTNQLQEIEVTIPLNATSMIINTNNNYLKVLKGTKVNAMPYSKWIGKKIAWFGTSIPETNTYNAVKGYPEYVGKLLGATVYNEAVGSSCARSGFVSAVSETDPYGVTGMGVAALWSLGGTITEKEEFITNWESKWRNLIGYNVAMTDAIAQKAYACSYENKLIDKYINTTPCDLYVFDHGYNDWSSNSVNMEADENDPYNRKTFQGAMNTFIKAIIESNPNAKIVMISHYESQERPSLIPMQENEAEYWNIPFCELYKKMNWAGDRTVKTTGYWDSKTGGSVWVESSETEHTYTLKQLHIPDARHPNLDLSGKACMEIGSVIANYLNTIV